ncbi:MAG: hypothetical protein WBF17_26670, partial [Phycisphaerae bacterium]
MWQELIEDIQLEVKLLRRLLEQCGPLREAVANETATETEKLAAASLLQSFYNGVESVFDLLAERIDGDRPAGPDRHETLLAQVSGPRETRPAVISQELRDGLKQYLEFRNSYRYSHYFRLDWSLMAALVNQSEATLDRLEAELDLFIRGHGKRRLIGRPEPEGLPAYWFSSSSAARRERRRSLAGPCLLSAIAGVVLGLAASAVVQYARRRTAVPKEAPAHEMRKLAASLASQIQPWRSEPQIRHAAGVLGFFDRQDWRFTFTGSDWRSSGAMTGRCPSLDATATFSFANGELAKIDIRTAWEHYVFSAGGGRLTRAAQHKLSSGQPQWITEFDPDGRPAYLSDWREGEDGPTRRDRFYRQGRLLLETVSRADGTVEKVVVRTGAAANA